MKIAILLSDLTANGGAPRQAMLLADGLSKLGHLATLYAARYCPESCYPEIARALDIRAVARLSLSDVLRRPPARPHGIVSGARRHFWESRQILKMIDPGSDILNPHVRGATRAAVALKNRIGTPVVWMCDDARSWEEQGYRAQHARGVQWLFDRVMARLEKRVVRDIDRVIALDERVKAILGNYYKRPTEVIRSGVDALRFQSQPGARGAVRKRHGFASKDFVLLWFGIIEPHRRLEDAIDAVALLRGQGHPEIRLLIAGSAASEPAYAAGLRARVERLRLEESVRFCLEVIPEADVASYYSAADALVYLAENQCWGLTVFEAIAADLPVIVSRACGASEVLDHLCTAMVVAPRDPADLARSIAQLAGTPTLGARLIREARSQLLERLTWEAYTRNMLRVFEDVIAQQEHAPPMESREAFA